MEASPLRGVDFLNGWAGQTTRGVVCLRARRDAAWRWGALSNQVYLNLVAYILDANGARPGELPLTADVAVMIGDAVDVAEARRETENRPDGDPRAL